MVESCWNIVWLVKITGWLSRNKMYLAYPGVLTRFSRLIALTQASRRDLSSRNRNRLIFPLATLLLQPTTPTFGRNFLYANPTKWRIILITLFSGCVILTTPLLGNPSIGGHKQMEQWSIAYAISFSTIKLQTYFSMVQHKLRLL